MCQAGASNQHFSVGDTWSTLLVYYSRLRAYVYQHLESMNDTRESIREMTGDEVVRAIALALRVYSRARLIFAYTTFDPACFSCGECCAFRSVA